MSNVDHGGGQRDRRSRHPLWRTLRLGRRSPAGGQPGSDGAARGECEGSRSSLLQPAVPAGFACSREQFESLLGFLDGTDAAGLSHGELEERLDREGRELLRRLLDDHLALRAVREQRHEQVIGEEGVTRGRVEAGHVRALETVFGTVSVERLAYRAPGVGNLHPADAALNLPVERHSHGLRKLTALESPRGSFADAVEAIERQTGQLLGKRQVEELASLAAMDFEDFYEARRPSRAKRGDLLVLSADGKGIVMRPDALRTRTPARPRGPQPQASAVRRGSAEPQADGGDRRGLRRDPAAEELRRVRRFRRAWRTCFCTTRLTRGWPGTVGAARSSATPMMVCRER
jgi:hypothetical protein